MTSLREAAGVVDLARSLAELRGDVDAARRLGLLRDRVYDEAEYAARVDHGAPIVRRRTIPAGATVGWLLEFCVATRAHRAALGLDVPEPGLPTATADLKASAA
jgi:hypothetical protein